jgi:hypothetical protein
LWSDTEFRHSYAIAPSTIGVAARISHVLGHHRSYEPDGFALTCEAELALTAAHAVLAAPLAVVVIGDPLVTGEAVPKALKRATTHKSILAAIAALILGLLSFSTLAALRIRMHEHVGPRGRAEALLTEPIQVHGCARKIRTPVEHASLQPEGVQRRHPRG